jgi:hypothetical protein
MSLKDYVSAIEALIAETPFVTATSLSYEERPPTAGLIKGSVLFTDGSRLDLKEFLIIHPTLRVIKYAYHYRERISSSFGMTMPMIRRQGTFRPSLLINILLQVSLLPKDLLLSSCYKKFSYS